MRSPDSIVHNAGKVSVHKFFRLRTVVLKHILSLKRCDLAIGGQQFVDHDDCH